MFNGGKMYKVTNQLKDVRKFRDYNTGKDILVEPGKFVLTKRPPKENDVWKVEMKGNEKKEEKKGEDVKKEKKQNKNAQGGKK